MEASRMLKLRSGSTVEFNNDFVGWLTERCLKSGILNTTYVNKAMCREQLILLSDMANLLNSNVTKTDMANIMSWLRRVLYDKARRYTSEEDWLKVAPDWLFQAAVRLRLLPAEQLPLPCEDVVLSACATRALLRRVHDTNGNLTDPLLELIWEDVRQSALMKLRLLVKQGDRAVGPSITDIEWRAIDLMLLHSSSDDYLLVTENSLESCAQKYALAVLCQLVQEHRLHECAGRGDLARRWGRAHHDYTSKKFHMSLVALQRRWFEVRRCSREWPECDIRTRVQQLALDSSAASYSWTDLVGGGMVFTQQDAIESEILNATSEWKLDSGPRVIVEEDGDTSASVEISSENAMVNCASDALYFVVGAKEDEQAQPAKETNNSGLPRRTGRFSSFLMFESDDDEPSSDDNLNNNPDLLTKEDSDEDVISLSEAILRIESEAVTAKRPKLANKSISATFDPNITLFSASNSLEVTVPSSNTAIKPESIVILPGENLKLESEDAESISLYPNLESSKEAPCLPEVPPASDCVMFQDVIDEKLLMYARVVIERMNIEKYMNKQRSAKKSGKSSKSFYVEDDGLSWQDSGSGSESKSESESEWSPQSAEESAGWSSEEACDGRTDEALRPVTLRDIDEVRRRAQRKLTAQVAPVTPAHTTTTTSTDSLITTLLQASGSQGDATAPLIDSNTVLPPVAVEVRQYCPLGLKATRLRYGQGMYRREMDAAAAARNRLKRSRDAAAKRKARKLRKEKGLQQDAPAESPIDDMSEWIRQRNLNSRYFGPVPLPLPGAKGVSKRRSSNPNVGHKATLKRKERAASLGKETAPTSTTVTSTQNVSTMSSTQAQHPVLTHALNSTTGQIAASVTPSPPQAGVIRIVPIASLEASAPSSVKTEPPNESWPQDPGALASDQSKPPFVRMVVGLPACPDPSKVPGDCAALWPVQILPTPPNSGESKETTDAPVVTIDEDSSASPTQGDSECIEKDKSLEALPAPCSSAETSTCPPLDEIAAKDSNAVVLEDEIFGNMNTVTAYEYIQGEDGSRLKIICKEASVPFWIVAGKYLVLAEDSEDISVRGLAYYTLAPPSEIKRIVFDASETEGADKGKGAGGACGAPERLAVQGKLYRKLCSAPLRYAQVLRPARDEQHARRLQRCRSLLLYHTTRRLLTPLHDLEHLLRITNKGANEEIVIDD